MYKDGTEVIYFAYKPDEKLIRSLEMIGGQDLKPDSVRVFLTTEGPESGAYNELADNIRHAAGSIKRVLIEYVRKSDFGHGKTRQLAMDSSEYEHVLLITQDAVPVNNRLISSLHRALDNNDAACAYARQIAYDDASDVEKIYRRFNYPKKSRSKTASDIEKTGIKAFFCSDVCCMYKHSLFDELGGFDTSLKFNEDSIFAFHALKAGYTVEYAADAAVYHSHDDSFAKKFKRSRDLARSQKEHPEVFDCVSSEHEGVRFFLGALKYLIKNRNLKGIAKLFLYCVAKYAGYFAGKHFD